MKHRVFIGYDSRERLAYKVARKSLLRRTDPKQVSVSALKLNGLGNILTRPIERLGNQLWCPISQAPMATEFAISRFCVPLLCRKGWALFVDCDVLFLADVRDLFALADERYAVMCVKHDHRPAEQTKMDGQTQTSYPRKNWSSVVLWNCGHEANGRLTREVLNTWPGRDLHAFKWLADEEIGELPPVWNVLVGKGSPEITGILVGDDYARPKLLHYTLGGPWIRNWQGGPCDNLWLTEAGA